MLIQYAPRQPPTLIKSLRINTLLIFSLRCLASAVLMLTPWVGPCGAGDLGRTPRGARASRALADGRALRARTGGRALRARTAPSAPTGPRGQRAKGALGFFRRLAEWKAIQQGSALEIVFPFSLLRLMFKLLSLLRGELASGRLGKLPGLR